MRYTVLDGCELELGLEKQVEDLGEEVIDDENLEPFQEYQVDECRALLDQEELMAFASYIWADDQTVKINNHLSRNLEAAAIALEEIEKHAREVGARESAVETFQELGQIDFYRAQGYQIHSLQIVEHGYKKATLRKEL